MTDETIKAALLALVKMNLNTADRQFAVMNLLVKRADWLSGAEKDELLSAIESDNKKLQTLSGVLQKLAE